MIFSFCNKRASKQTLDKTGTMRHHEGCSISRGFQIFKISELIVSF